ncbi:MAG TPA: DUF5808 domain-containing protein [Pseudonocardiaceae bacterium]|nr:DUF5808 domain-containing protein [Pseudonocardiaceae bacterium]
MAGKNKKNNKMGLLLLVAAGAAVLVTELRKPQEEREWHGTVGGVLPYDLRKPTAAKLRDRYWNVDNPHLLVPQAFGIGWTINFGRVYRLATESARSVD